MTWPDKRRPQPRSYRKDRLAVLERDSYRCQIRGTRCIGVANIDDHRVPLSLGGSNDLRNRQAACKPCHDQKTTDEAMAAAKAARDRAKRPERKHPGLLSTRGGMGAPPATLLESGSFYGSARLTPETFRRAGAT